MRVLGINDGHNAAACLYENGRVVAAVQEERLRRIKNWWGMPTQAIAYVLQATGISVREIDWVAMNGHYMPPPMTREELMDEYEHVNDLDVTLCRNLRRITRQVVEFCGVLRTAREHRQHARITELLRLGVPSERVVFVEHHTAHAAAAYYGWARFSEEVLVLTADGSGDGICASISRGRNGKLERLHTVPMAQSLGNIYAMMTFIMGMVPLEHEYKLMGLAPYADPKGVTRVSAKLSKLVYFDPKDPLGWVKSNDCPETLCSYRFFQKLFERERFDALAGGLQRFIETMLVQWVKNCIQETGIRRVALGGGIFMNVKANKLIAEIPEVDELFIYPSCGDETNAMGAAYWVYAEKYGAESMYPLRDLYWGPRCTDDEVANALDSFPFRSKVNFEHVPDIERQIANLLANGQIVARHGGHEEFGARSLGNRAILANARNSHAIRVINEAIKSRDFWMPFASSIRSERATDYIINPKKIPAPYMILTFDTTERRSEIQSGVHPYDGTVRPQVVERDWNPRYHRVIEEFDRITGIGGVLNTSFNLHGYPIASSPLDSLEVLDRSGLTTLAIENWIIQKQ